MSPQLTNAVDPHETTQDQLRKIRDSLIESVLGNGLRTVSERDLLFYIMSFVSDARLTTDAAAKFLDKYGKASALLSVHIKNLDEIFRVGVDGIAFVGALRQLIVSALREPLEERPVISDMAELYEYLRLTFNSERREIVRILFLDRKNKLIKDELHSEGDTQTTNTYPREIVRRAMELDASALIIVHNHPSGDPAHSEEDVRETRRLVSILGPLGIILHDSIIVGRSHCESLRALGLLG